MKRLLITLLLLFSFASPAHSVDLGMSGSGSVAARMMESMWDMMEWFFTQRSPSYRSVPWNYVNPTSPWTYTYPGSPWNSMNNNPWSQPGRFGNRNNPVGSPWGPGFNPQADGSRFPDLWNSLDGVWRATSGEYWIVKGNQFVLYGGGDRYMTGTISVQGDHIIANIPVTGMTFDYRYWLMDGMLIVRDEYGQAMVLDLVQPTASHWQW